jgi:hypothetical protein
MNLQESMTIKQSLKGLVIGGRTSLSMGRVSFWLCFLLAIIRWSIGSDIPGSHVTILTFIMGYCFGGKYIYRKSAAGTEIEIKDKSKDDKLSKSNE